MSHVNYVLNVRDGCASVRLKQAYSLHRRAIKVLMPAPDMDYIQKGRALRLLPLDKQLLLNKCVLMGEKKHTKKQQHVYGKLHNT